MKYGYMMKILIGMIVCGCWVFQAFGQMATITLPPSTQDTWRNASISAPPHEPEIIQGCKGESLKVEIPNDVISAKIKFMDMAGRVVWSGPLYQSGHYDFDVSGLPPGVYLKVVTNLCNYVFYSEKFALTH